MDNPLRFTPLEATFVLSFILAIFATVLLLRNLKSSTGISYVLVGLVLAWIVPVVGPAIVIGITLRGGSNENLAKQRRQTCKQAELRQF